MKKYSTYILIGILMVVDTLLLNMPKDLMKPDLSSYEMMQFISNLAISGGLLMILWTKEQPERRV
tara:strand:- start:417 stop:611 length:195 start_codon:yes stop_codon:yes gene_type:complete